MPKSLNWIARQDARHRLAVSFLAAILVWFGLRGRVQPSTQSIATWDTFAICVLVLAWLTIITTPPQKLHARAQEQDVSRTVIFVFVILASCAGLFAVGLLFFTNKGVVQRPHFFFHLLMSLVAVVSSWMLVHTVFGLRYAMAILMVLRDRSSTRAGWSFPGAACPITWTLPISRSSSA